jgi:diguanylate cyclase (GGDEF)-like protein
MSTAAPKSFIGARGRLGYGVVVVALAALLLTLEVLLFSSYGTSERTNRDFSQTTNATAFLANAQRETLQVSTMVLRLERRSDLRRVETRVALLERHLSILEQRAREESAIATPLRKISRSMSDFSRRLRAARRQPLALARARLAVPLVRAERQVKSLYDEQEHALYGALADTLRDGERSQRLIVGLATFALLLAAILAILLRRSIRSSFRRAYAALEVEIQERTALQEQLTQLALHDSLTGLPNRRSLLADLERGLADATSERPLHLLLFDLDGFKAYNDSFGHPAGDALLSRLGHTLARAVDARGSAYRMGGDEFCVLASHVGDGLESLAAAATAALSELGEGFSVTASYGAVSIPTDATEVAEAMRIADQRMYARKSLGSRASAGRQSTDVLLMVLAERDPELGVHVDEVTELCHAVAAKLGLPDEEIAPLLQAASLHDVGKTAIPDEILNKPGPLDDDEFAFMRRHTLIGERILGVAPALANAAKLVRSSHERFDGHGYPDRLHGHDIPLGARIIAVCDAYHAMTSNRAYRVAMSAEGALSELRRCAGSQFDPAIVDAFRAVVDEREQIPGVVQRLTPRARRTAPSEKVRT